MRTYLKTQYNKNKRQCTEPTKLVPISFVELKMKQEKDEYIFLKKLFDLGTSSMLVSQAAFRCMKNTVTRSAVFSMAAGHFSTHGQIRVKIKFLEFNPTAEITKTVHMTNTLGNYTLIIG